MPPLPWRHPETCFFAGPSLHIQIPRMPFSMPSPFWIKYIMGLNWILRKPPSSPFLIFPYGWLYRLMQANVSTEECAALRSRVWLETVGSFTQLKEKACGSQVLRRLRKKRCCQAPALNVKPSQCVSFRTGGDVGSVGLPGPWSQRAAACLTVLCDARLQTALMFLNPLKYLISGAYEALQKN